jgi:DNA modification methylase
MSTSAYLNSIVLGDCMNVLDNIEDDSIDFVITDPPYGVLDKEVKWDDVEIEEFTNKWWSKLKNKSKGFLVFWSQKFIPLGYKIFNPDRMLIWWHPNLQKPTNNMYLYSYDPIFFIRGKTFNGCFSRGLNADVKSYAMPQSNFIVDRKVHGTQKPLQLLKDLVEVNTNEGDIVLDPFAGSGTTCLASKILGRRYIGIEKDKKTFDIAIKRLDGKCDSVGSVQEKLFAKC